LMRSTWVFMQPPSVWRGSFGLPTRTQHTRLGSSVARILFSR
jgi:hypothetical protein